MLPMPRVGDAAAGACMYCGAEEGGDNKQSGSAARGVVDTPTPGKGCCGRATRVDGQHDHVCWVCAHCYHGRRPCAPELCLCALKIVTVQRQTVTYPPFAVSAVP